MPLPQSDILACNASDGLDHGDLLFFRHLTKKTCPPASRSFMHSQIAGHPSATGRTVAEPLKLANSLLDQPSTAKPRNKCALLLFKEPSQPTLRLQPKHAQTKCLTRTFRLAPGQLSEFGQERKPIHNEGSGGVA